MQALSQLIETTDFDVCQNPGGCKRAAVCNYTKHPNAIYCMFHALPGMTVVKKKCQFIDGGCSNPPWYTTKGERFPMYCEEHRLPKCVKVNTKYCQFETCVVSANYNYPRQITRLFCGTHRLPGMVNIQNKSLDSLPPYRPSSHDDDKSTRTLPKRLAKQAAGFDTEESSGVKRRQSKRRKVLERRGRGRPRKYDLEGESEMESDETSAEDYSGSEGEEGEEEEDARPRPQRAQHYPQASMDRKEQLQQLEQQPKQQHKEPIIIDENVTEEEEEDQSYPSGLVRVPSADKPKVRICEVENCGLPATTKPIDCKVAIFCEAHAAKDEQLFGEFLRT